MFVLRGPGTVRQTEQTLFDPKKYYALFAKRVCIPASQGLRIPGAFPEPLVRQVRLEGKAMARAPVSYT